MAQYVADECFSGAIIRSLRAAGFDVVRTADACPGADDETVLSYAYATDRILLTEDQGFGELCVRLRFPSRDVVVVAVKALNPERQARRVAEALTELGNRVRGAFVTIEPSRTRMRALGR